MHFKHILMSFALSLSESVALLIALVVVAALFSLWVYRHTVPEITRRRRIALVTLRTLALSVLLFLLFEPVLNLQHSEQLPPRVAVLVDDSRSMTVEDGGIARSALVRDFVESAAYRNLEGDGTRMPALFAGKLYPMQQITADSLRFTGGETDISSALQEVYENGSQDNLRSVVLVTDGVFTAGKNPLYAARALGLPVHVVAVGDSTEKKDVLVSRVLANSIAYLESTLPVDVTVRSAGFDGERTTVRLLEGDRQVAEQVVQLRPGVNEYPVQFVWTPGEEGVRRLTVRVDGVEGELTARNNVRSFFVKVLKSRMNIVIVAGAPSADVSLLQRELRKDRNIATQLFVRKSGGSWYEDAPVAQTFLDADCIILAGFPAGGSGSSVDAGAVSDAPAPARGADVTVLRQIAEAIDARRVPLFLLPSRTMDFRALRQGLDAWLPYDIVQARPEETEVFFELAEAGRGNPILSSGLPADLWTELPPLFKTESSFRARAGTKVLGTMRLNNISFDEPLLMTRSLNRSKVLAWTAYGLWRWELAYDVLDGEVPGVLVSNAIRWLTTREDDKRVRIRPVKEFFDSGDEIELQGQVYNESYEPVDNAAVSVTVRKEGEERELILNPRGSGRYSAVLDITDEGDYSYSGTAVLDGRELGSDEGRFSVGELNIEFQNTRMNNVLLRQIAAETDGSYHLVTDAAGLPAAVQNGADFTPVQRLIKEDIQLWNIVWLLALAVLFFAAEWFLRKQAGMM
ncbi:MAG: vWA domain-containing protein [Bacteroidota bacterium]|nr:vWA domain-containing protein [Bacteroidota bacterium]